jgi:hypothetical protein
MKRTRGSSDRGFGLVFASALALWGLWPLRAGGQIRLLPLCAGAILLLITALRPSLLRPLNRLWTKLGLLMGRIVNPVVTSALFLLVFTPAGMILRLLGKDLLGLKAAPGASTYWVKCEHRGSASQTMPKQF